MVSKFDMALEILMSVDYKEGLNMQQLRNMSYDELQLLYDKYVLKKEDKND